MKYLFLLLSFMIFPQTLWSNDNIGVSVWVSHNFVQTFFASEYHGQNVSQEKDQAFGFKNLKLKLSPQRAEISGYFWYERSLTGKLEGDLKTSFSMAYVPERKRVMMVDGTVDKVKFRDSPGLLKPLLLFAMETALNRVAVTSRLKKISLGENVSTPINQVEVLISEMGVLSAVNEIPAMPETILPEVFGISMEITAANNAIQLMSPELFPAFQQEPSKDLKQEVSLVEPPQLQIQKDPKTKQVQLELTLKAKLRQQQGQQPPQITEHQLQYKVNADLTGRGQLIKIHLRPVNAKVLSPPSAGSWNDTLLKAYLDFIEKRLEHLAISLPPVQFIPKTQQLQKSQMVLQDGRLSLGGKLLPLE